ncbi:Uncharacterised protein [Vibrio fluvialis]|uniref:Uncharacterized protein n=1 Tax=Vibrio fluvialis TaxID=676 RepID=A0AAX2LP91_VIBFL|nr:Uncharacterised protein [Vibrio fluvialis]
MLPPFSRIVIRPPIRPHTRISQAMVSSIMTDIDMSTTPPTTSVGLSMIKPTIAPLNSASTVRWVSRAKARTKTVGSMLYQPYSVSGWWLVPMVAKMPMSTAIPRTAIRLLKSNAGCIFIAGFLVVINRDPFSIRLNEASIPLQVALLLVQTPSALCLYMRYKAKQIPVASTCQSAHWSSVF